MIEFALDLTWVRHKIVGGTEAFVNNLIRGFLDTNADYRMHLLCASDNSELFKEYERDPRVCLHVTTAVSAAVWKRLLWQNLNMSRVLKKMGIRLCLEPVYAKPFLASSGIRFLTVIHDLEALHYPENHSKLLNMWLRFSWKSTVKTSRHVVCISDFVRNDIIARYKISEDKLTTIFDPIYMNTENVCDFGVLAEKYSIVEKDYYYTVSKLNPHKNLSTLVRVFGEIKKRGIRDIPNKLLISGVNGGMRDELEQIAQEYGIQNQIVLTGFVQDDERNSLYKNAKAFLFPSVFEGFGMPPVEALCMGATVITTREACIPEITQERANYVQDAHSVDNWISALLSQNDETKKGFDSKLYDPGLIANQYLGILEKIG